MAESCKVQPGKDHRPIIQMASPWSTWTLSLGFFQGFWLILKTSIKSKKRGPEIGATAHRESVNKKTREQTWPLMTSCYAYPILLCRPAVIQFHNFPSSTAWRFHQRLPPFSRLSSRDRGCRCFGPIQPATASGAPIPRRRPFGMWLLLLL